MLKSCPILISKSRSTPRPQLGLGDRSRSEIVHTYTGYLDVYKYSHCSVNIQLFFPHSVYHLCLLSRFILPLFIFKTSDSKAIQHLQTQKLLLYPFSMATIGPGEIRADIHHHLVYSGSNPNQCLCGWYVYYSNVCGHLTISKCQVDLRFQNRQVRPKWLLFIASPKKQYRCTENQRQMS